MGRRLEDAVGKYLNFFTTIAFKGFSAQHQRSKDFDCKGRKEKPQRSRRSLSSSCADS